MLVGVDERIRNHEFYRFACTRSVDFSNYWKKQQFSLFD